MTPKELNKIIDQIVNGCFELKNKYIQEKDLEIDYLCIFSQNQKEYQNLIQVSEQIGKVVNNTPTGPVYAFNKRPKTIIGSPKLLKIRLPDKTRPQRGDVDFNTNYPEFKEKYLNNKEFTLIQRVDFEMIELKDSNFNVLLYFSNIPPSKQLGIF